MGDRRTRLASVVRRRSFGGGEPTTRNALLQPSVSGHNRHDRQPRRMRSL
jgi:hypothetical protein